MEFPVKQEIFQATGGRETRTTDGAAVAKVVNSVIDLSSSSSSDSDSGDDLDELVGGGFAFQGDGRVAKKRKLGEVEEEVVLPLGFLASLPPEDPVPISAEVAEVPAAVSMSLGVREQSCKQFWKAGNYEGASSADWEVYSGADFFCILTRYYIFGLVFRLDWVTILLISGLIIGIETSWIILEL